MSDYEIIGPAAAGPSMEVVVGAGSRFFAGHFPGRPVLPAVAQLMLVEALLRRACGGGARIVAVDRLRLLQPSGPGDRLTVRLEPGGSGAAGVGATAGSARFRIERGATHVSEGVLHWSSGGGG